MELDKHRTSRNVQPLEAARTPGAILKFATVQAVVGLSRSTIHLKIKKGEFPAPAVRLGARCVRWRSEDVMRWLESVGGASA